MGQIPRSIERISSTGEKFHQTQFVYILKSNDFHSKKQQFF